MMIRKMANIRLLFPYNIMKYGYQFLFPAEECLTIKNIVRDTPRLLA